MVLTMTIVISLTLGFLSLTCRVPPITITTGKALYVIYWGNSWELESYCWRASRGNIWWKSNIILFAFFSISHHQCTDGGPYFPKSPEPAFSCWLFRASLNDITCRVQNLRQKTREPSRSHTHTHPHSSSTSILPLFGHDGVGVSLGDCVIW